MKTHKIQNFIWNFYPLYASIYWVWYLVLVPRRQPGEQSDNSLIFVSKPSYSMLILFYIPFSSTNTRYIVLSQHNWQKHKIQIHLLQTLSPYSPHHPTTLFPQHVASIPSFQFLISLFHLQFFNSFLNVHLYLSDILLHSTTLSFLFYVHDT